MNAITQPGSVAASNARVPSGPQNTAPQVPEMSLAADLRAPIVPSTMRAAVIERFGGPDVVSVRNIPVPQVRANEVLVRVAATTVSAGDRRLRARDLPRGMGLLSIPVVGLFRPRRRILGMDVSGTVAAVGSAVRRFRPGDEVVGLTGAAFGAHAEFVALPETAAIAAKPPGLSHEDAVALMFGGHTLSECIRRCPIRPGDEVLVNGASGAVGSTAVQVARYFGAKVTAVTSAGNAELVRDLGADKTIDYRTADFTKSGKQYDVVVDCVGNAPFERSRSAIKPGGALLLVAVSDLKSLIMAGAQSRRSGIRVIPISFTPAPADVEFTLDLHARGALRPLIEARYRLEDVADAHRQIDTGRKRGALVISVVAAE